MALFFAHGAVQWTTANALNATFPVTCTDVGGGGTFQPKAIRFYCLGLGSATDTTSTTVHERRSMGFAVGTASRRCVATQDQDAAATMVCSTAHFTDCVIATISGAARDGSLDLSSLDAAGFTLIVDDVTPVNITVFWEAWGGTDITVAAIGDITEPAATGNQDYTVTGFTSAGTDQVVLFAGVQGTAADTSARNSSGFTTGVASSGSAGNNVCVAVASQDTPTTANTNRYGLSGECLAMIPVLGGNPNARAQLTQFNTDGFRLNWIARGVTNRRSIFLAIKGGQWQAGEVTVNAATVGNTGTVSAIPFAPLGVCAMGVGGVESAAGTGDDYAVLKLGVGTSTSSRRSMSTVSEDALGNATIDLSLQYDALLTQFIGGTLWDVDLDLIDSSSFRLIWDGPTTEAVVHWHGYLTFGSAAGGLAPSLLTETVKVGESLTLTLDPEQATPTETLNVADTATTSLDPEATSRQETIKVADPVTPALTPLECSLSETTKVSDAVTVLENPLETSLSETVKVADSVTPTLFPLQASAQESVKIGDVVTPSLNPLQTSVQDVVKVADTVSAALMIEASLSETVKVADILTVVETPLQTALTDSVKVSDAATPTLFPLQTTAQETVKVADTLGADLSLTAGLLLDVLRLAEILSVVQTPLETSSSELLRIADVVTPPALIEGADLTPSLLSEGVRVGESTARTLTPEETARTEVVRVVDTLSAGRDLDAAALDVLRLTDTLTAQLTVLPIALSEGLRITDSVATAITPVPLALAAEGVKVADAVAAIVFEVTADAHKTEVVRVTDSLTVALAQLAVSLSEGIHCQDAVADRVLVNTRPDFVLTRNIRLLAAVPSASLEVVPPHDITVVVSVPLARVEAATPRDSTLMSSELDVELEPV